MGYFGKGSGSIGRFRAGNRPEAGARRKDPATDASAPAEAPSGVLYPHPAIPPETQDFVYQTLVTACDQQMTEAQVAKLVEKVKTGHPADPGGESAQPTHRPQPAKEHAAQLSETSGSAPKTPHPSAHTAPHVQAPAHSAKADKTPNANGQHNEPLAQPNHAPRLEASQQVPTPIVSGNNVGVSTATAASAIAAIQPTPTAHTDVVGQVTGSVAGSAIQHLLPF